MECEGRDHRHQVVGLGPQPVGRGSHLFNQCGVLLRALVHLSDRLAYLLDPSGLLIAGG